MSAEPWKVVKHKSFNLFDSSESVTVAIELGNGAKVALLSGDQEANAELIVKAVNAHEALFTALGELLLAINENIDEGGNIKQQYIADEMESAREALKLAGEGV